MHFVHCGHTHCGHTALQVRTVFFRILFAFKKYARPNHDVPSGGRPALCPLHQRHPKNRFKTEWRRSVRSLICSSPRYTFFQLQGGFTLRLELRILHFSCDRLISLTQRTAHKAQGRPFP